MHLNPKETDWIIGSQGRIECTNESEEPINLNHAAYVLTESGKELFPIISIGTNKIEPEYINTFVDSFIATNSLDTNEKIKVSIIKE